MKKMLLLLVALLFVSGHAYSQSLSASCTPILNSPIAYSCPFAPGFSLVSGSYVKLNGNSNAIMNGATSDTAASIIGVSLKIVQSKVIIQTSGAATLNFDGATTSGDTMTLSTTTAGYFHDTGSATCSATALGVVSQTIGSAGQATAFLGTCAPSSVSKVTPSQLGASAFTVLTDAAAVTWPIASVLNAQATLTFTVHSGSRTLNITGPVIGGNYTLKLIQDSTGGEGLTLGTGCTWKVASNGMGAITLTNASAALDVLTFFYDGTNCIATTILNAN